MANKMMMMMLKLHTDQFEALHLSSDQKDMQRKKHNQCRLSDRSKVR